MAACTKAMKSGWGFATVLRYSGWNDADEPGMVLQLHDLHELALRVDARGRHARFLVGLQVGVVELVVTALGLFGSGISFIPPKPNCHETSAPPPQPPTLNRAAFSGSHAESITRSLPFLAMFALMLAHAHDAHAQTITIYNETNQAFALNPLIATTCTPPGTQQLGCIQVAANGSNTYTPPSGYICYGFKISCGTSCTVSPEGSVSCAGQGRPFDCSGNTYVGDFSGSEVRIND